MASGELKTHPVFVVLWCLASLFAACVIFMYVSNARAIALQPTPISTPKASTHPTVGTRPQTWVLGATHNGIEVDVISTRTLCVYTASRSGYNSALVVLRKAEMEGGMCQ